MKIERWVCIVIISIAVGYFGGHILDLIARVV